MVKYKHWTRIIHEAMVDECEKRREIYLTKEQARIIVQTTTGYSFPVGTTTEDIYKKLEDFGIITRLKPARLEQEIIIPLKQDKKKR